MAEFDYIRWVRQHTPVHPRVVVGPGDDCAVLRPGSLPLLVKADMLLEDCHFRLADAGPRRVGRKALAVNLSDIAAMGGRPLAAVVSLGLPRPQPIGDRSAPASFFCNPTHLAEEIYLGMRDLADTFRLAIVGGDTNSWHGGLVVSVALLGESGPQGPILRSGARPGDWLFVTGPLGGSILGKHLDFVPRVAEALALQEHAPIHAMLDVSDGLAADLHHLCRESGCGAVLVAERIPISAAARQLTDGRSPLDHALADGEDFELIFAVAPADGRRLLEQQPIAGATLSWIGECTQATDVLLEVNGSRRPLPPLGYVHPL
ncbi:MAG: thiamine-phosphate kinase [Gemmataceae bacterium]|nr:thiamine-phosphate kinase [Gemmataceae bacterium]